MSDPFAQAGSQATTISYPPGNTGSHAVIELQKAFYHGQIPREAAIGASTILCDISSDDASRLFPKIGDFTRLRVKTPIVIAASLIGCCVGYVIGNWLGVSARPWFPHLNGSTVQALTSTVGVFVGAVASVLGVFAWNKYAEKPLPLR